MKTTQSGFVSNLPPSAVAHIPLADFVTKLTHTAAFDWLSDLSPAFSAQEAWHDGSYHEDTLFHLVYRPDAPFAIACGAGLVAEHVRQFRFSPDRIQRMGQVTDGSGRCAFSESFLNHLQRLRLRVHVWAAPEGMLLLPGEPLLIARGPYDQILLLESAFRYLVWRSTQWATRAAQYRWDTQTWAEEDTPVAPTTTPNLDGWKIRAEYIGGADADQIIDSIPTHSRPPAEGEGLVCAWRARTGNVGHEIPLTQIRRLYKSQQAVGDVWLTEAQEEQASVSKTSARLLESGTSEVKNLRFTRFQNLYQPLLAKGHPALANTRISYLRQRTLKQLEAFHTANLLEYPRGWWV
jgi:hypothetical protein